jgi:hypothetical protein
MCQFGNSDKILNESIIDESNALIGYRVNYGINSFNNKEKFLKSLNQNFIWNKKEIIKGNPTKENSEGIYSYNYYYYNHNYNHNNNYDYYDYNYNNNNNHNYNHNNYSYNYDYNNHNYYNICLKIKLFGKVFSYKEGYRSEFAIPYELVILDKDSEWFKNSKTIKFANHFNNYIEILAKEYNCKIIEYKKFCK